MRKGLNNDEIQKANRSLILQLIIDHKMISRVELANITGLQKPTITNIINDFLSVGVIEECELPKVEGVRKAEGLKIKADKVKILTGRWTRSFFTIQLCTFTGAIVKEAKCLISTHDEASISIQKIFNTIDGLLALFDKNEILGMCIGVPGPYIRDHSNRAIVAGYEKLRNIDIQKAFEEHYKFPVFTEHDAKLSAFAEWKNMDLAEQSNCKCLLALQSIGIGIGAGIILHGDIVHGAFGIAGEIGQMGINFNGPQNDYGERGTLESYASSVSVKNYVSQRLIEFPRTTLKEDSTYEEIVEAYKSGDPLANWAFDAVAWKLAYGLSSTVFVISPDKIIIGPDYPKTERFIQTIKSSLENMVSRDICNHINICFSKIIRDPTLMGGYYLVLKKLIHDNSIYERIKLLQDIIKGAQK